MNRLIHTLVPLLAAVLLMAATAACVEPIVPEVPEVSGSTRVLPLQVGLPGEGSLTTKATTGQEELVVGPQLERKVYYLQIWAFKHQAADATTYDNSEAVCYYDTEPHAVYTDGLIHLLMPMPDDLLDNVGPANPLKLDFYVLINGESVGVPENASTLTRKQLKEKVFANTDGSGFGSGQYLVTAIPDGTVTGKGEGLPMSGFFNNGGAGFDMTFMNYGFTETQIGQIHEKSEDVPQGSIDPTVFQATSAQISFINTLGVSTWEDLWKKLCPVIETNRAISKVRFIFSKAPNMVDENGAEINTEITSIQLIDIATSENPMLPASTYLFPRESGTWTLPTGVSYEAISLTGASGAAYLSNAAIQKINDTPLRLRKDSKIESKIETNDTGKKAPDDMTLEEYEKFLTTERIANHLTERILYLRESDKSAIIARISYKIGTSDVQTIDIPLGTDFHRNRWWTVYTYFMSYTLGFQVTVHPWNCVESQAQQLEEPEEEL